MERRLALLLILAAGPALAQQPAPPAMLVPRDLRPGEVAPDPGMTVPERIIPAPPGHGAAVPLPPASSEAAVVPHGGGDPGILVPPLPVPPPGPAGDPPRQPRP
jgi:hypothetical protein